MIQKLNRKACSYEVARNIKHHSFESYFVDYFCNGKLFSHENENLFCIKKN